MLFRRQRWANADQLYGFSAECGLKAMLVMRGRAIKGEYKQHVQDLWPEFMTFADGPGAVTHATVLPNGLPFADWSHHDRYAASTHFSEARVAPHRDAAEAVVSLVQIAMLGGAP